MLREVNLPNLQSFLIMEIGRMEKFTRKLSISTIRLIYIQTGRAKGNLPTDLSFMKISPGELVFSALKKAEDENNKSFVLRIYIIQQIKLSMGKFSSLRKSKMLRGLRLKKSI